MVEFVLLTDAGTDPRGESYAVPAKILAAMDQIGDVHLTSIVPGAVRGDHYHVRRKEVLIVSYRSPWIFHWDEGVRSFEGAGVVAIVVEAGCAHALKNTGSAVLWVFAMLTEAYDPVETVRRVISQP